MTSITPVPDMGASIDDAMEEALAMDEVSDGSAVQVDPVKSQMKPPESERLKLKCL